MRACTIILATALLAGAVSCATPAPPLPTVQITATELYNAFAQDETGAAKRFEGKALAISGEVASTWGAGPPRAKPSVTFKGDSGGIINCSGNLPVNLGMYEKGAH